MQSLKLYALFINGKNETLSAAYQIQSVSQHRDNTQWIYNFIYVKFKSVETVCLITCVVIEYSQIYLKEHLYIKKSLSIKGSLIFSINE
jgi:hypothetical protein